MTRYAWAGRPLAAVLFDLDGTLLDTAADITLALNRALAGQGLGPLPGEEVRRLIGRGSPSLIRRAVETLGGAADDSRHAEMLEAFFRHYDDMQRRAEFTARPYPGAAEALAHLHGAGIKTAVVTNKQHRIAEDLLRSLALSRWVDVVVGGDTCARRKPDPEPIHFACERLGVATGGALMVGDSVNDVQAARAAGIPVICVPYGYNDGADPRSLSCDALIDSLAELPGILSTPEVR